MARWRKRKEFKEWWKEYRATHLMEFILYTGSEIVVIIAAIAYLYVNEQYGNTWRFVYQWGSTFNMLVLGAMILGFICNLVVGNYLWKRFEKSQQEENKAV